MSEFLCAGKARKLHVKFGAFTTSVTSAVGSFPLAHLKLDSGDTGQASALPVPPPPPHLSYGLIKPSFSAEMF